MVRKKDLLRNDEFYRNFNFRLFQNETILVNPWLSRFNNRYNSFNTEHKVINPWVPVVCRIYDQSNTYLCNGYINISMNLLASNVRWKNLSSLLFKLELLIDYLPWSGSNLKSPLAFFISFAAEPLWWTELQTILTFIVRTSLELF